MFFAGSTVGGSKALGVLRLALTVGGPGVARSPARRRRNSRPGHRPGVARLPAGFPAGPSARRYPILGQATNPASPDSRPCVARDSRPDHWHGVTRFPAPAGCRRPIPGLACAQVPSATRFTTGAGHQPGFRPGHRPGIARLPAWRRPIPDRAIDPASPDSRPVHRPGLAPFPARRRPRFPAGRPGHRPVVARFPATGPASPDTRPGHRPGIARFPGGLPARRRRIPGRASPGTRTGHRPGVARFPAGPLARRRPMH